VIEITIAWIGRELNKFGLYNAEIMVKVSKDFYKPLESDNYRADYLKDKNKLKWHSETKFRGEPSKNYV
jgi:GDP-D-mannose dehydratase